MKKFLSLIVSIILLVSFVSCKSGVNNTEVPNTNESMPKEDDEDNNKKGTNILNDSQFYKGFNLLGLNSAIDGRKIYKKIRYGNTLGTPQWDLAQWWSKYDLKDGVESSTDKRYSLKDASKGIEVNMANQELTLDLNAEYEFDSYNLSAPARWPHLLLEQALIEPIALNNLNKLNAKLSFVLNKEDDKRDADGKGLHAQFAWFIYIVDTNPESPGYRNFLWFGLNIYDSNRDYAGEYKSQDTAGGLGNFINSLGSKDFLESQIEVQKTMNIDFDIIPHVKLALDLAKQRGFMPGTEYKDLSVTGTNIGWEVFDRWNVSVTIKDIGLIPTVK